jgi:hypothetical protein
MRDHSDRTGRSPRRKLLVTTGFVAAVAAVALAVVPVAFNSDTPNALGAYAVVTTRGPLPGCSGPDCTLANQVESFIHVANFNQLKAVVGTFKSRETLVNSFVVKSIDLTAFVNGTPYHDGDFTYLPPPNVNTAFGTGGHWVNTVTCPVDAGGNFTGPPCNVVGSPAAIPGENTVVLYTGWAHGVSEPKGDYVFKYTIHGTLNGTPLDLIARTPTIAMS